MPDHRDHLTQRAHAQPEISLGTITQRDANAILAAAEAGLIDLDHQTLGQLRPRLQEWTYDELEEHLVTVEDLADSTIRDTLRYLRSLEDPGHTGRMPTPLPPPVDLRPPDEATWRRYVVHRRRNGISGGGLNDYRKAVNRLLRFLGIDIWPSTERGYDTNTRPLELPPDELVPRFWARDNPLHEDPYIADLVRAIFHWGFHAGWRPPSELADADLDGINWSTREITWWEEKKDRWRKWTYEPFAVTATNGPSLAWYVDHVRPRVDTGESDALFLTTRGTRYSHAGLRNLLSPIGKQVWPRFTPYTMRHWMATSHLVANDLRLIPTARRLGDTTDVVERHYLEEARIRAEVDTGYRMPRTRGSAP